MSIVKKMKNEFFFADKMYAEREQRIIDNPK